MSDSYLILHKVSGEPAFDIAIQLETEEEIWIIPTSGHRAYPYQKWPLNCLILRADVVETIEDIPEIPKDWPEHYQNARSANLEPKLSGLFQAVMNTVPKFLRRA